MLYVTSTKCKLSQIHPVALLLGPDTSSSTHDRLLVAKGIDSGLVGPQSHGAVKRLRAHVVVGDEQNGQVHVDFLRDMEICILCRPVAEGK